MNMKMRIAGNHPGTNTNMGMSMLMLSLSVRRNSTTSQCHNVHECHNIHEDEIAAEDDDERSGRRRIQMKMQMGSQAIRVGLNPTPNRQRGGTSNPGGT